MEEPACSSAILDYARRHDVTRIILGKPTHSRLRDRIRGSLLDEVVRGSGDIEVNLVSGDDGSSRPAEDPPRTDTPPDLTPYVWATAFVALSTVAVWLLRGPLALPGLVMLYLVVIAIVAVRFGRGYRLRDPGA